VPKKRGVACSICTHPERWRCELLKAGGASNDALAKKFGISKHALHRHWHNHVSAEMRASYLCGPAELASLAERAAGEGASVLDHFRAVRGVLMAALANMAEAGDARGAAIVAAQLVSVLEKIGRVTGELAALAGPLSVTNNIAIMASPAFTELQAAVLRALVPHHEARAAVVAALRELDAKPSASAPLQIEHEPTPCAV
jgi:hypothetical protein